MTGFNPHRLSATRRALLKTALGGFALSALPRFATAAPAQDGVLTVGTNYDIVNFDPYAQTINALILLKNLNAWLVDYDENLQPQPSALESFQIAPARDKVILKIRDNVVFHTGKTMDVDDVVFAFERALDPKRGFNLAAPTNDILAGVKALDKAQVELTLKQPTSSTLITDLLVAQPVVDKSKNDSAMLAKEPASAGPYRVTDWRQGESLTLEAFDKWYRGAPKTKKVVIKFFTSPAAAVTALASGALDVLAYPNARDASRLTQDFNVLQGFPGASTQLLRISTKTAPFDNKQLRQALSHSVNRDRIVEQVLFGFGGPAFLPWGPNSPAQDKSYDGKLAYDLAAAKTLLEQSGAAMEGNAMVLGPDQTALVVMQIIQQDLASIGFKLNIEQVDSGAYNARLVAGEFGVVLGPVGGGQLSTPRITQNSLMRLANNPLWANGTPPQAYVDGMKVLIAEDDADKRKAAYGKINDVLVEESWGVGTYYIPILFVSKKDLNGVARDHQNALVLADAAF